MTARFPQRAQLASAKFDPKHYTMLAAHLMAPLAATGYALAAWRFASDMNWLGAFVISDGLFSKWQVWLVVAIATQAGAHYLNRASQSGETSES